MMKKTKRIRMATMAGMTVVALSLTACGGETANKASGDKTSGATAELSKDGDYNQMSRDEIKDGGTLTLPIPEISEQQNDFQANGTLYTRNVWSWYNPQMALFSGSGDYTPNPDYITEVKDEVKDGKTVVTYKIVDKATFNDGTPIDYKAFENTWKMNNGENKELQVSATDGYELIESVQPGASDKEVVVTFQGTYPWWQGLFNHILHPAVNTPELFNEGYLNKLHPEWGAGPYKVENADFNAGTVTFVPNEKWWGDAPKLEKVTYRQMEDQASINAFQAGEIDATAVGEKNRYAVAKGMGDAIEIHKALRPSNFLMTLNSKTPALKDIKVREAIFTAVDRSQLAAIRFNGLDYKEELPGSFILYQTQDGYEDNFGSLVKFDPEKSKQLLDEAGWKEGSDGIREKDGQKLSLRYVITGDSEMVKATASANQKMLKDVGVDLKIEERPSSDFSNVTSQRDFDVFLMGFNSGDPFGPQWFGQTYASDSELNKSGTGTPELDKKIEEMTKLPTTDEQTKKSNELEKEALATFGIMPYANGPDLIATKKGLANYGSYSFAVVPKEDIGWEK